MFLLVEHEGNCAEQLRSVAEDARNDLDVLGGRRNDPPAHRLTHGTEQDLAGGAHAAADDDALGIEEVAKVGHRLSSVPAGVRDRALASRVALERELDYVFDR